MFKTTLLIIQIKIKRICESIRTQLVHAFTGLCCIFWSTYFGLVCSNQRNYLKKWNSMKKTHEQLNISLRIAGWKTLSVKVKQTFLSLTTFQQNMWSIVLSKVNEISQQEFRPVFFHTNLFVFPFAMDLQLDQLKKYSLYYSTLYWMLMLLSA